MDGLRLQLPEELFVTLVKFHDEQRLPDGTETVALRTLEAQACGGDLPGAVKIGGKWYVNKLALLQLGLESVKHVGEGEVIPEAPPAPEESSRGGRGRARGKQVAREEAEEGAPPPLRYVT
ncbi:MAG: hypothetical protein ACO1SV_27470 [Fimbriimonas sp.]